jgi:ribosome-binding protein aMBF1 (putative translation factor)
MPKTTDAIKIIHQMIADDPTIQEQIVLESLNAEIAQLIYHSRTNAGLTKQQLADLIYVEQSVIEDLEDADYQDNPLIMLQKIATALNQRVKMSLVS